MNFNFRTSKRFVIIIRLCNNFQFAKLKHLTITHYFMNKISLMAEHCQTDTSNIVSQLKKLIQTIC